MKILYIASVRIPNEKASGLAIMRQCESFSHCGQSVTLVIPFRRNTIVEDAFTFYGIEKSFRINTMHSIDFYPILGKIGFFITRASQMFAVLIKILRMGKSVQVLYTRDPWMIVLPLLFCVRKKIVVEIHKTYNNRIVHYVVRKSDVAICITHGLKEHYAIRTGRKDIVVEPSGVNLEQFKNAPSTKESRERLGISMEKRVIGYVGKYKTMGEEKGIDSLVEAFAMLRARRSDIHLLISGLEPSEVALFEAKCHSLNLQKADMTLLPLIQKDFVLYVQAADILVMNYPNTEHYRMHMSPTKLFAYMGVGKTVIASDLPSVREIVDESMVVFVRPGDSNSLQHSLERALQKDQSLAEMTKKASLRVQEFAWDLRARRILERIKNCKQSYLN